MKPVVSVIVPTYDRHDRHMALYETFASQTLAQQGLADMHILDDSSTPSPVFSSINDSRVHYRHVPQRMSIGAKRNALAHGALGEYIEQFDDDDAYAVRYLERKLERMRATGADLLKLSVWNAICERDGSIWQWDTREIGPEHYAVTGVAPPEKIPGNAMSETSPELLDSQLWGYGFSYGFKRSAWERAQFPDMNLGEDYAFIRRLRELGANLVHVADMASSVLHTVHPKSTSVILPQRRLRSATLGSMPLTLMPAGDLYVKPGVEYTLVALIKVSNDFKDITAKAQSWGLNVLSAQDNVSPPHGESVAPAGYRYILAEFTVSQAKKIPAKVPWPMSHLDKSRIVRAWSNEAPQVQINQQLTPQQPGVGGGIFEPANTMCDACRNFAWTPGMGPVRRGADGWLHHPTCPKDYPNLVSNGSFNPGSVTAVGVRVSYVPQPVRDQINPQLTPKRSPTNCCG
jgi:hypothetical protein